MAPFLLSGDVLAGSSGGVGEVERMYKKYLNTVINGTRFTGRVRDSTGICQEGQGTGTRLCTQIPYKTVNKLLTLYRYGISKVQVHEIVYRNNAMYRLYRMVLVQMGMGTLA